MKCRRGDLCPLERARGNSIFSKSLLNFFQQKMIRRRRLALRFVNRLLFKLYFVLALRSRHLRLDTSVTCLSILRKSSHSPRRLCYSGLCRARRVIPLGEATCLSLRCCSPFSNKFNRSIDFFIPPASLVLIRVSGRLS